MTDNYYLKNYTEVLVDDNLKKLWEATEDICKCRRCYYDTKALALNQLAPKYVVTNRGEVYAKIDSLINQKQVDVMAAIMRASQIVNENYSHSQKEVNYVSFER